MAIIEIWCEETGTFVTLKSGEENHEALTLISMSADLATPQHAWRFVRTWALAREQEWFDKAPRPLQHTLAVIRIYGQGKRAYTRMEATHRAADEQGVHWTTIDNAYTRALGNRNVADFDRLLDGAPEDLHTILARLYPEHGEIIERYMSYLD